QAQAAEPDTPTERPAPANRQARTVQQEQQIAGAAVTQWPAHSAEGESIEGESAVRAGDTSASDPARLASPARPDAGRFTPEQRNQLHTPASQRIVHAPPELRRTTQ